MNSSYITSAQKANQLPPYDLPEFAFIGRSNSGKSSLLNALLERKNLARSSSTPGRTQMINFFSVELSKDRQMVFADLPGYGFNAAPREVQELWDPLMAAYAERPNVKAFVYLMDIRRSVQPFELTYMSELASRQDLIVVLTKADKVRRSEMDSNSKKMSSLLAQNEIQAQVHVVSNLKKSGVGKLRDRLWAYLPQ